MEPNNEDKQVKKYIKFILPHYAKEDKKLQERQNRLLFWQNIFTVCLGVAQILVAVILAVKVF